jgi:hypothetical protein
MDPASIYTQGFRAVKNVVAKRGPDVLKVLPRRWKQLVELAPTRG